MFRTTQVWARKRFGVSGDFVLHREKITDLTEDEIREFMDGDSSAASMAPNGMDHAMMLPYKDILPPDGISIGELPDTLEFVDKGSQFFGFRRQGSEVWRVRRGSFWRFQREGGGNQKVKAKGQCGGIQDGFCRDEDHELLGLS